MINDCSRALPFCEIFRLSPSDYKGSSGFRIETVCQDIYNAFASKARALVDGA